MSAPTTTFVGPSAADVVAADLLTTGAFLAEVARRYGPAEAVVLDDALLGGATVRWTYDDLLARATTVARSLMASGVATGDRVAVLMGNRPEALAAIFGAGMIGAVAAPVSTFATVPELEQLLGLCGPRVVLTQSMLLGRRPGDDVAAVADSVPSLVRTAVLGTDGWDDFLADGAVVDDDELHRRGDAVRPSDPALVVLSSGTTAAPKGVLHTHRAPTLQFWVQARVFGRDPSTRMFSALPIFWTAGLNTAVGSTLAAGGCWVAQETFEARTALALLERERVTEPYTLPHQTAALAEQPEWLETDLSSVRCAYGKGAYARHPTVRPDPGWIMPVGYGLSETCAFVAGYCSDESRDQMKVGNGRLLPGTQLRVVEPTTGELLGPGSEGELAVAGETLMIGYLGRDPADCVDRDGFFHTGDLGHVDGDGIVHFTGRRTELIRTGGANVSPAEVEVALRAFGPVKLSRVIGIPDERLDEVVVACVVVRDGARTSEQEVKDFLRGRVAPYKVPRHVVLLGADEVPMTAGGTKVRDDDLRPLVLRRLAEAAGPTNLSTVPHADRPEERQ